MSLVGGGGGAWWWWEGESRWASWWCQLGISGGWTGSGGGWWCLAYSGGWWVAQLLLVLLELLVANLNLTELYF